LVVFNPGCLPVTAIPLRAKKVLFTRLPGGLKAVTTGALPAGCGINRARGGALLSFMYVVIIALLYGGNVFYT